MDKLALERAAAGIAKGNLTPQVVCVRVVWEESTAKILVQYIIEGEIGDDDQELCELTLAELSAEFPDIRTAETACLVYSPGNLSALDGVVFLRD